MQEGMYNNKSTKQTRQKVYGENRMKQKSCFGMKIIEMACREKVELTLAVQLEIVKELKYEIEQASLLTCPDFVVFKGFEIHLDTL